MSTLETFVEKTIQKGIKEAKNFEELRQILDTLDKEEKPIYLRYEVSSNV